MSKPESPKPESGKSGSGKKVAGADGAAPRRGRTASEPFIARRRGAAAPVPEGAPPEPAPEFEPVALGESEPEDGGERRDRTAQRQRMQKELDSTPLAAQLGLRLDYADNGVSRVHLPAKTGNTAPGPMEGGVVGTICVAAGHLAAASIAPGVGIRLVEYKLSILGVVQGDLLAIGEVVRKGRTLVACRIEVVEDNDRVVAVGLGTYLLQQT